MNQSPTEQSKMANNPEQAANIYQFKVRNLDNEEVPLDKYKGQVLLVVNTAANCGLTKNNIKELKELYAKYQEQGVKVLGFPSNDFKQELDCEADIKMFVEKNGIEFDYFGKIHVNGKEADPLYKFLKAKQGGFLTDAIKWNYTKFLVDKNGIPVKRYSPTTSPSEISKDIDAELAK